jgi:hypothetical protein
MTSFASTETGTRHARRRRPFIIAGFVLGAIGLAALLGGWALVNTHATKTDGHGFYASDEHAIRTSTRALVAQKLEIGDDDFSWIARDGRLGTLSVTTTGTDARPVFVGIARQSEVDRYLRAVEFDEIDDLELDPFSVTTQRHFGTHAVHEPTSQTFWATSAHGSGKQRVEWDVQEGNWVVVVMNADGTPGVQTRFSVGAKVPIILWAGIALVLGGAVVAILGGLLVVAGFTGARRGPTARARSIEPLDPVDRASVSSGGRS